MDTRASLWEKPEPGNDVAHLENWRQFFLVGVWLWGQASEGQVTEVLGLGLRGVRSLKGTEDF